MLKAHKVLQSRKEKEKATLSIEYDNHSMQQQLAKPKLAMEMRSLLH